MEPSFDELAGRIIEVAPTLHSAGTFSASAFEAILRHARVRTIEHSAETGSGASTLLLSHLSGDHTVFALDEGSGSVSNVRRSPLFDPRNVRFVEGPTQWTLPHHSFPDKLQFVLIDGPHGYPFPDLEYYFLYPHLDPGALLVLDDIQIRSIHHLFEFLRRDAMFELDEVVHTTAFFTRTDAPTFDPLGDGWWNQRYNANPLFRYVWKEKLKGRLPGTLRRNIARWKRRSAGPGQGAVRILQPTAGERVGGGGDVEGSAAVPDGAHLWVLVHRSDLDGWWPQGGGPIPIEGGRWRVRVAYGEPQDFGYDFEIAAVVVQRTTNELWTGWVERVRETGEFPPVRLPPAGYALAEAYRRVRKVE